jgi:hypothetical protein
LVLDFENQVQPPRQKSPKNLSDPKSLK